jgi:hypothetical protein
MMMELATNYDVECKGGLTGFRVLKWSGFSWIGIHWWWKVWIYGRWCCSW